MVSVMLAVKRRTPDPHVDRFAAYMDDWLIVMRTTGIPGFMAVAEEELAKVGLQLNKTKTHFWQPPADECVQATNTGEDISNAAATTRTDPMEADASTASARTRTDPSADLKPNQVQEFKCLGSYLAPRGSTRDSDAQALGGTDAALQGVTNRVGKEATTPVDLTSHGLSKQTAAALLRYLLVGAPTHPPNWHPGSRQDRCLRRRLQAGVGTTGAS